MTVNGGVRVPQVNFLISGLRLRGQSDALVDVRSVLAIALRFDCLT